MHGRDDAGRLVECTTSSMVAELRDDGSPHRAWVALGSPCEHEYTEVTIDSAGVGPGDWSGDVGFGVPRQTGRET